MKTDDLIIRVGKHKIEISGTFPIYRKPPAKFVSTEINIIYPALCIRTPVINNTICFEYQTLAEQLISV